MSEEQPTKVDQRDQAINGPQTNIAGDVHGPVLSGVFNGPIILRNFLNEKVFRKLGIEQRVGFLVLALLIVGMGAGLYFILRPKLAPMTGDFNVAVAQFQIVGQGKGFEDGKRLSQSFTNAMDREIQVLSDEIEQRIEVRPPSEMRIIQGTTDEERAKNAHIIAEKINADVVIYGVIHINGLAATIKPEFYVRNTEFSNVAEITGQYRMGSAVIIDKVDNMAQKREVGDIFAERFRALTFILYGLADYVVGNYEKAGDSFSKVLDVQAWDNPDVIYVMLGNVALRQRDWVNAEKYYSEARTVNSNYARAYIGLGSTYLALATTNVQSETYDFNISLLDKAIEAYQLALDSQEQPPLSDVSIRASFGLGDTYLRKALLENEAGNIEASNHYFNLTEQVFQLVIRDYETGNVRIQELAAHTHARLGLLYWQTQGPEMAIPEFEEAIELLPNYGQGSKDKIDYQEILKVLRDSL